MVDVAVWIPLTRELAEARQFHARPFRFSKLQQGPETGLVYAEMRCGPAAMIEDKSNGGLLEQRQKTEQLVIPDLDLQEHV